MYNFILIVLNSETTHKPLVAVSGASGFVGTHLRAELADVFEFRALSRSASAVEQNAHDSGTQWRQCDLYSLPQVTNALEGCEYAFYLVHSMAPSSRLMQSDFEDTDLLLADNFVRAAEAAGVKHIIYLSGLLPDDDEGLSPHLRSRREVEEVLRSRSVTVTVLRAGLIFGSGGSSFSMLINLVRRLPIMLLPAWTGSMTHTVDILNVCQAFRLCLEEASFAGGIYDLGGHTPMSYRELIFKTGALLNRPVRAFDLPVNCFAFSKHWVALFGGVATTLVGPLQESLQHDLKAKPNPLLDCMAGDFISFEESFAKAVDAAGRPRPNPRSQTQLADKRVIKRARRVRSVQRMAYSDEWTAATVTREYGLWLSRRFRGLLSVDTNEQGVVRFLVGGVKLCLLELTPTPFSEDAERCAFYITGGCLSRRVDPPGRLEFRVVKSRNCVVASIHGFAPTLPWWLYANTQALAHLMVMRAFSQHLSRIAIGARK